MKQFYTLITIMIFISNVNQMNAQTEWTGPMITFTKADMADWTLEVNQDRITNNVWITRQDQWSIFNIAQGDISAATNCNEGQPNDTEWAFGTIADGVQNLTFGTFLGDTFVDCNFGTNGNNLVGQDAVLHLITDDIYIDIKFLSWTSGGGGGGFSYERSTDQSLSVNEFELEQNIKLFPNPSNDYIQILGLIGNEKYTLYNVLGAEIKKGNISNNEQIDIRNLTNGLYFLKFGYRNTIKFIKE